MDKNIKKTFTVLLPLYQRKDLQLNLPKVLSSIYNNTVIPNALIILIDGELTSNFYNSIRLEQKKYNFTVLKSKKVGLAKILNKGIEKVNTCWISRMDGDDLCEFDRFENSIKFMKFNYDLFGGQVRELDCRLKYPLLKKVPCSRDDIIKSIKYRNPFNHMTVFFKTDFVKKIGGYPDLYLKEDYALWCKFIYHGAKVANMNKIVVNVKTDGMHARRGGIKYIISEIKLQKILLSCNLTNVFTSIFVCILRITVHALPNQIKFLFYNNFLRKKI